MIETDTRHVGAGTPWGNRRKIDEKPTPAEPRSRTRGRPAAGPRGLISESCSDQHRRLSASMAGDVIEDPSGRGFEPHLPHIWYRLSQVNGAQRGHRGPSVLRGESVRTAGDRCAGDGAIRGAVGSSRTALISRSWRVNSRSRARWSPRTRAESARTAADGSPQLPGSAGAQAWSSSGPAVLGGADVPRRSNAPPKTRRALRPRGRG